MEYIKRVAFTAGRLMRDFFMLADKVNAAAVVPLPKRAAHVAAMILAAYMMLFQGHLVVYAAIACVGVRLAIRQAERSK